MRLLASHIPNVKCGACFACLLHNHEPVEWQVSMPSTAETGSLREARSTTQQELIPLRDYLGASFPVIDEEP